MQLPAGIVHRSQSVLVQVISLQKVALEALSLVKGLRNLSTPIGRLPGDLLEQIFAMRASERDLLTATCVCRRWREILVSSPRLWVNLRCEDTAQTLQYLARSNPAPIYVAADFYSDIQAVFALKPATDRFGSLKLRLESQDLLQAFHRLTTPALALEHLEIHAASHLGAGQPFPPSIPVTFLGGFTPALRSLHLGGINSTLNFSVFPALTRLTLVTNSNVFHMSELFRVFASAKLLEEVTVQLNGPTTPIPGSQNVVQLPKMQKLSFSNTVGKFPERLLSLLFMPFVEEIKLDISLPGGDARTMRDFLPAQLRNFPHLLGVDDLKLAVPHAHCNIRFSGPAGVVSVHASRRGSRRQNDDFQSHWLGSLEPMSITGVKSLALCNYHPEKPLDQCPVLESLQSIDRLRSLVVERCNNAILIKTLSPTTKGSILFPYLESLTLQLITKPTTIFPDLVGMARSRSRSGSPLSKVTSDQYTTFCCSDVDALRRHVGCVQLNTEADHPPSKPIHPIPHKSFPVSILFVWDLLIESSVADPCFVFFFRTRSPHAVRPRDICPLRPPQAQTEEETLSQISLPRADEDDTPRSAPLLPYIYHKVGITTPDHDNISLPGLCFFCGDVSTVLCMVPDVWHFFSSSFLWSVSL